MINTAKRLMYEPRGHHDMFGALITEPVHEEADFGVIFMDTGEYLNMCGHGTIGTTTALIESGLAPVKEPYTEIVLDAPCRSHTRRQSRSKRRKSFKRNIDKRPCFSL